MEVGQDLHGSVEVWKCDKIFMEVWKCGSVEVWKCDKIFIPSLLVLPLQVSLMDGNKKLLLLRIDDPFQT